MNILIGLLSWFFFVILYGQISRNMYERKECILGIKISYRIARLLGFSGHKKKISIFVFIYQIIYYILTVTAVILFFVKYDMIWDTMQLYTYFAAFNFGLCAILYSLTRIIIHKGIN